MLPQNRFIQLAIYLDMTNINVCRVKYFQTIHLHLVVFSFSNLSVQCEQVSSGDFSIDWGSSLQNLFLYQLHVSHIFSIIPPGLQYIFFVNLYHLKRPAPSLFDAWQCDISECTRMPVVLFFYLLLYQPLHNAYTVP